MTQSMLSAARALFDIPDDITYLNAAGMAPYLRSVTEAGLHALHTQTRPWTRSIADWFSGAEEVRALIAQLLGAHPDAIALVPSASYGIATAAANLPISAGQNIALVTEEYPSQFYAWQELAKKKGARLLTATRTAGQSWAEALDCVIDANTAIVAATPCHWMDGARIDLEPIAQRARGVGAAVVIDASQYLGAAPIDIARIQPDFLVSVAYKWLLGPYGLGFLYAAPRWQEHGTPIEHSWLARAGAETFARSYTDQYRDGARRFDMGGFPQFTLIPMAIAALRQVVAWQPARIAAALALLTEYGARRAREAGLEVLPAAERAPHILGIQLPPGETLMTVNELSRRLAADRIYVSAPGDAIRVSPHLYSTQQDFDRLFAALARHMGRS